MRSIWTIFANLSAICLLVLCLLGVFRPGLLDDLLSHRKPAPIEPQRPTATVKIIQTDTPKANLGLQYKPSSEIKHTLSTTIITSYADAVNLASPSVVSIYTTKIIASPFKGLRDVPSLRPFIIEQYNKKLNEPTDLGSGVIANAEGYILTNYHVVEAADSIEVALYDGRKFKAKFIGADPDTDLAVIKIEVPDLVPITYETSQNLSVGDVVLAIGNPFGVGQTTTMGIVSAIGRSGLGINTYENFIQTDASINPGNSGGALINVNGKLVGINTAIYADDEYGGSLGIGFATPADTALNILNQIITNGHVTRGWLGIEAQLVTSEVAKTLKLNDTTGVVIIRIEPGSPADKAKLKNGDVITAFNGSKVISVDHLMIDIASQKPGDTIKLTVFRDGHSDELEIVLESRE
ncbi:trypsin-like peptidase domain-containing protein [Taylorella equigenitalis]|uniref:S1C family serine protease n=1 Tax=Taylorella equigenitalis TaxID=29575 RepID=UPI00040D60AE|nr:trypsin-like peptidase domain-containing protein [Taylorella equigenitalis]WDU47757.1 trypsin-like peptidase domain-containing protein [Taylorella equigenitalis]